MKSYALSKQPLLLALATLVCVSAVGTVSHAGPPTDPNRLSGNRRAVDVVESGRRAYEEASKKQSAERNSVLIEKRKSETMVRILDQARKINLDISGFKFEFPMNEMQIQGLMPIDVAYAWSKTLACRFVGGTVRQSQDFGLSMVYENRATDKLECVPR